MSEYKPIYFSIRELTASDTASRRGIDNTPSEEARQNILRLIQHVLDPLREKWGAPIYVNSGYRCPKLNEIVGGAKNSQHLTGQAADITAGSREANHRLWHTLVSSGLSFDQLIREKDSPKGPQWLHVSYASALRNRNMKFSL